MSVSKNDVSDNNWMVCEDISPVIVDLGFQNCKFGHNQQDFPRIFFNSICGEHVNFEETNCYELKNEKGNEKNEKNKKKLLFPLNLSNIYEHMKIKPLFYKDALTNTVHLNCDVFETIMEYSIEGITPSKIFEYNDDVFHAPIKIGGMHLNFEEHPMLLSDFNNHNNGIRKIMAELLFEKYNTPALYFAKKAKLTSYSVGRTTSLVIDIGASSLNINPVYEGYVLQKKSYESDIGGNYLDSLIYNQLVKENVNTKMLPDFCRQHINNVNNEVFKNVHSSYFLEGIYDFIRYMKSSICRVRVDATEESEQEKKKEKNHTSNDGNSLINNNKSSYTEKSKIEKGKKRDNEDENENGNDASRSDTLSDAGKENVFELPDGSSINVENYKYDIAEALFKTISFGTCEYKGLLTCIKNCVLSNDVDIRKDLLQSIVLTGGSSLFPGLPERLYSMLREEDSFSQTAKLRLINLSSSVESMYSSWLGGSILASLGTFQQMWISKEQYFERGHQFIDEKCY